MVRNSPTRILAQAGGRDWYPKPTGRWGSKHETCSAEPAGFPNALQEFRPPIPAGRPTCDAQVCQLCSISLCRVHRVLSGEFTTDREGKALGGLNCQCWDGEACILNQRRVMAHLQIPEDIMLRVLEPHVGGGKCKDKGKQKKGAGKGQSQGGSESSSSRVW